MRRAGIGWQNLLESATLSAGSYETALPLNNIKTRELADVARTTNDDAASTKLIADHGSAKYRRAAAFKFHNCSSAATVTWSLGTTSGGSDVATLTQNCWQITPTTYSGRRNEVILVLPQRYSARYDLFEFTDTSNPDGYMEVAYGYVCDLFVPTWGIDRDSASSGIGDQSGLVRMRSGIPAFDAQRKYRTEAFTFPALIDDEGDTVHEMLHVCGTSEPVLYIPDMSSPARVQRYGFIGSIEELRGLQNPFNGGRSMAFQVTEW
jgi:hypothetical protein